MPETLPPRLIIRTLKETHLKILKTLESNPEISQRELAGELGISLGKTNYCMKALVDKGLVKARNFRNSQNKLAYAYILTPKGIKEKVNITRDFLHRKTAEYEALKQEIESLKKELSEDAEIG